MYFQYSGNQTNVAPLLTELKVQKRDTRKEFHISVEMLGETGIEHGGTHRRATWLPEGRGIC